MSDFIKQGTVKRTIKYTDKSGEEKNRYVTVGEFWSTDGGNRRAVKIYATLNTDEQWLNIYPLEDDRENKIILAEDPSGSGQTRRTIVNNDFSKQEYKDTHEINKAQTQDDVVTDIDDKPIDLSDLDIPF